MPAPTVQPLGRDPAGDGRGDRPGVAMWARGELVGDADILLGRTAAAFLGVQAVADRLRHRDNRHTDKRGTAQESLTPQPFVAERRILTRAEILEKTTMWKNGQTDEEVAEKLLRNYLIRCHRTVSEQYPEIRNMEPEKAADFLLHLRKIGRVEVQLYRKDQNLIGCQITERDGGKDPNAVP